MSDADSLLLKSNVTSHDGEMLHITPDIAGWEYCSLAVRRVNEGDRWQFNSALDEVALVLLGGRCRIESGGQGWELGARTSVFDGQPWALYLPPESEVDVIATSALELAVCGARTARQFSPVLVRPEDIDIEIRGAGNACRQINHIIKPEFPAHRLLIVEVFTPSGNWSSYPPHKHDVSNLPVEADLEEIYYYRIDPPDGFALQRLYTADGEIDRAYVIGDGDLLLVPRGYHAFAVGPGYTGYYLNVLAGNESIRTMQPSDDPRYAWVRGTWSEDMVHGLASWKEIDQKVNQGASRRP